MIRGARALGLALALGLSLAGFAAEAAAEARPVSIDLLRGGVRRVDDAWARPRGGRAGLELAPGARLELFLRLPDAAVLELTAAEGGPPAVSIRPEAGEEAPLSLVAADGGWRAPLGDHAGRVVRLRLRGAAEGGLRLTRARVRGSEPIAPPPLPPPAPHRAWNVLVYVVDALRPDRLSLYGYQRETSPRLDAFAARAHVFENAYATGPDTLHSIPALFTSLPADEALKRLRFGRRGGSPTLAERFRAGGFATAAFQANFLLKPFLGFARGFGRYRIVLGRGERGPLADAAELHAEVFDWIQRPRRRPFFLYVQSLDVHNPYRPPPPFRGRFGGDPERELDPAHYDAAVAYQDHELGSLLAALQELGLGDETLVVVTSDHGESLGEGGRTLHGTALSEELVRVPLLVSLPGQAAPARDASVVSLMDLAPTLLELAGQPVPRGFAGRSLLRPPSAAQPRSAVGEKLELGWFVREADWKLVVDPSRRRRLYHLASDPDERRDLAGERPVVADYLTGRLWQRSRSFRHRAPAPLDLGRGLEASQRREVEEALRALGYAE